MSVTHLFVSALPDGADATLVRPSNWNEAHVVSIDNADVAAGAGIVESKLSLNFPTHAAVTIGTANGLSLVGQAVSLGLASAGVTGALSGTDWTAFNSKQNALTFPLAASLGGTGIANGASATLTLPNAATTITGGGTLALGGFTLTVPATGTAALLATANVFIALQSITNNANASLLDLYNNSASAFNVTAQFKSGFSGLANTSDIAGQIIFAPDNSTGSRFVVNVTNTSGTIVEGMRIDANRKAIFPASIDATATGSQIFLVGGGDIRGYLSSTYINLPAVRGSGVGPVNSPWLAYVGANGDWIIDAVTGDTVVRNTTGRVLFGFSGSDPYALSVSTSNVHVRKLTTTTNAVTEALKLEAIVSTASTGGTTGFGTGLSFYAETATDTTSQFQGAINTVWRTATNASRKASMLLYAYDTAARLGLEIEADGSAAKLGFYGVTPVTQPTTYTQTYSTASKTNPTATAANLSTTAATQTTPWGFASQAQADDIATQVNKMQTDYINLQKLVNAIIDDLQALGLAA